MQEIEKVKVLQSEREALKLRTKGKETEKKAENHTETVCPECGGRQLVHDYERAELVCQGCGLVIDDDFIDRGPEWRAFDHDQRMKRSRVAEGLGLNPQLGSFVAKQGLGMYRQNQAQDAYQRAMQQRQLAQLPRRSPFPQRTV